MKERRRFIRFDVVFDAFQLHPVFGGGPERIKSRIKDLSRGGLRLFSGNLLPKKSSVELEMNVPGDNIPIFAFSEVMWSNEIEDVGYDTGMRFTKIKPEDKARLLDYAYTEWSKIKSQ